VADAEEYVDRAAGRIVDVLDEQHAVVNPELQARISEAGHRGSGLNVDPHHVTTALRRLSLSGIVVTQRSTTRGWREIVTFRLGKVTRRETKIEKATQRKRVLMARCQGWSQGTKRHPHGTIGPAGEAAVRSAILAAGSLVPAAPGAGEVIALLGTPLRGPVDSAGYMVPILKGLPQSPVTVLFEVKNLRSWIYPSSIELYQLLHKAAVLQRARPDELITGILICRRAHPTLYWMAGQLGFAIIEMDTQFAGSVDSDALDEVRVELNFADLRVSAGPSLRVRDRLASDSRLVQGIADSATNWKATALNDRFATPIAAIRKTTKDSDRLALVDRLRARAVAEGHRGGW